MGLISNFKDKRRVKKGSEAVKRVMADKYLLTTLTIQLEGKLRGVVTDKTARLFKRELGDYNATRCIWKNNE